jgi:hypothetical protein
LGSRKKAVSKIRWEEFTFKIRSFGLNWRTVWSLTTSCKFLQVLLRVFYSYDGERRGFLLQFHVCVRCLLQVSIKVLREDIKGKPLRSTTVSFVLWFVLSCPSSLYLFNIVTYINYSRQIFRLAFSFTTSKEGIIVWRKWLWDSTENWDSSWKGNCSVQTRDNENDQTVEFNRRRVSLLSVSVMFVHFSGVFWLQSTTGHWCCLSIADSQSFSWFLLLVRKRLFDSV